MAFPLLLGLVGRGLASGLGNLARVVLRQSARDLLVGVGRTVQIRVTTNIPDVIKALDRLHRDLVDKAMATAINRTLERGRTEAVRQVRERYNIKAGDVRQVLRIRRASPKAGAVLLEGVLYGDSRTRSVNVIKFGARVLRKAKGASVQIRRSGGKKIIKGSFIANAGRTVFRRKGKDRLPIEGVQTIGPVQMFGSREVLGATAAHMTRQFDVEFQRAAALYLNRWGAASR